MREGFGDEARSIGARPVGTDWRYSAVSPYNTGRTTVVSSR